MDQQITTIDSGDGLNEGLTLGLYAERAYLEYATSVVKGRALPEVADGQKPVQRRILFAMNEMGLGATAKPVKSARVVGDVLGKFHPHGDQAAYDALVRMAQNFSLRYPLIDGQGNFGSRDGDGAAAMRYTEARLTPISRLLLDEIDEGTVDFRPNYDGSTQEPALLPARLPFALLNGASGIAVGMATEMPSHNLSEVAQACLALLKNSKLTSTELLQYMPGPDYPGGGHIISQAHEIAAIYETGRGSLKVRARGKIEEMARGQWQLVIYELPPNVSAQKVQEEIEELTNPKIKTGKKTLTPEQLQTKQHILSFLDTMRDESGRDAPVRLVFEPKSKNVSQVEFANLLLAHTSMECSAPINLVAIGLDGRPKQKNLRDIIGEWLNFRMQTVTRRTQHRLNKVNDRIHILEGRLIVYLNIDEVIQIIRESDTPKSALMEHFSLSERQAEDILEIRLRQLARLEKIKIEQELANLRDEQARLAHLLQSENAMRKLIAKEIEQDAKQYGDERRTLIEAASRANVEQKVVDEPVTVIISNNGWLRTRTGHGHDAAQFNFKAGDSLYQTFECRTPDTLLAFGSNGRVYSVPVSQLPGGRGDGVPVTTLIDLDKQTQVVHYYAGDANTTLLLSHSGSYGFSASVAQMTSRLKAGKQFINLGEGDCLLAPVALQSDDTHIACLSKKHRLLVFAREELKQLSGGGKGVILQELEDKETLLQAISISSEGLSLLLTQRGQTSEQALTKKVLDGYVGKRARKGKQITTTAKQIELRAVRLSDTSS